MLTFRRQDLIVVSPGVPANVPELKQVRAMGITVPMLGGDGWESVQDFGGDAIQGAYYSNH